MSVTSTVARSGPFLITALPQIINTGFPFETGSDLIVYNSGPVGLPYDPAIVLTLGSDYTISGGGYNAANQLQLGSINVVSTGVNSVAINDRLVIARNIPINQPDSFQTTGTLTIVQLEQSLDRQATISQEINEGVTRSLRFEPDEFLDGTLFRDLRKGNVLGFDSNGNLTYYAFVGGVVLPQSVQGTLNQVLVNGSVGIPTTGAITLTLPQSIATSSTPQFSRLGLGTPATANSELVISRNVPVGNAQASLVIEGNVIAPAGVDLHPNAFRDVSGFSPSVVGDAYASYDSQPIMGGTINPNHFHAYQARHSYVGSGTFTGPMSGFATLNMGLSGTGTIPFMRGFYVSNPSVSGGGSVGQFDGLYIDQLTAGTTRHAIYIAGNDDVFMAGGQLFTSALLTTPAGATTCRMGCTFDQASQTGLAVMNSNATATGTLVSFCNNGGTVQGTITQVNSTTVAYNTSSDRRLKENIRPFTQSGEIVDALQPVIHDWKWGGKDCHGFIAQDLHEVFPEAVSVGQAEDGKILMSPWGVDYSKLIPVLTAEIKSLRTRVSQLENLND